MGILLILVDGMRPGALTNVDDAQDIIKKSAYIMKAKTVMPSVMQPCHMSLFHSVDQWRHVTTTNIYSPQVRPIKGLCEMPGENTGRVVSALPENVGIIDIAPSVARLLYVSSDEEWEGINLL